MKKFVTLLAVLTIFIIPANLGAAKNNVIAYSDSWNRFIYEVGLKCHAAGIKYSGEGSGTIPGTLCIYFGEGREIRVTGYSPDYKKSVNYIDVFVSDKNTFTSDKWVPVVESILLTMGLNSAELENLGKIKDNHSSTYCESKDCYVELSFEGEEKGNEFYFFVNIRAYKN